MTAWVFIIVAIALIAYDPIAKTIALYRNRKTVERQPAIITSHEPTRIEAFQAAEVLIAYYDSIGHHSGTESAMNAAQWLFAEPE
jgi:hypothetical protein